MIAKKKRRPIQPKPEALRQLDEEYNAALARNEYGRGLQFVLARVHATVIALCGSNEPPLIISPEFIYEDPDGLGWRKVWELVDATTTEHVRKFGKDDLNSINLKRARDVLRFLWTFRNFAPNGIENRSEREAAFMAWGIELGQHLMLSDLHLRGFISSAWLKNDNAMSRRRHALANAAAATGWRMPAFYRLCAFEAIYPVSRRKLDHTLNLLTPDDLDKPDTRKRLKKRILTAKIKHRTGDWARAQFVINSVRGAKLEGLTPEEIAAAEEAIGFVSRVRMEDETEANVRAARPKKSLYTPHRKILSKAV